MCSREVIHMHANTFDLEAPPFQRLSGNDDWYRSKSFGTVVDTLRDAARRGASMLVLTGDTGVGKSSVIHVLERTLMPRIHLARFDPRIFSVRYEEEETQEWFEASRLQEVKAESSAWIAQAIRVTPESARSVLIAVDDAHELTDLELRGMLNAVSALRAGETELQMLLVGSTELEARLRRPPLAGSIGRIGPECRLEGLAAHEVGPYIGLALEAAGGTSGRVFTRDAIAAVAEHSRGIPRLVNNICGAALVIARESGNAEVPREAVEECLQDLFVPEPQDGARAHAWDAAYAGPDESSAASNDAQLDLSFGEAVAMPRFTAFENAPLASFECDQTRPEVRAPIVPLTRTVAARASNAMTPAYTKVRSWFAPISGRLGRTMAWQWLLRLGRTLRGVPSRMASAWRRHATASAKPQPSDLDADQRNRFGHFASRARGGVAAVSHSTWIRARSALSAVMDSVRRRPRRAPHDSLRGEGADETEMSQATSEAMSIRELFTYVRSNGAMVGQLSFAFALLLMAATVWVLVLSLDASRSSGDNRVASSTSAAPAAPRSSGGGNSRTDEAHAKSLMALGLSDDPTSSILSGVEALGNDSTFGASPPTSARSPGTRAASIENRSTVRPSDAHTKPVDAPKTRVSSESSPTVAPGKVSAVRTVEVSSKSPAPVDAKDRPYTTAVSRRSADGASKSSTPAVTPQPVVELTKTAAALDSKGIESTHTVVKGDTLWGIARAHDTTVDALLTANNLGKTAVIHPGQKLKIATSAKQIDSAREWHVVRRGDTLYGIGKLYGVSIAQLQSWNDLANRSALVVGQRLRVRAASDDRVAMTERK